jgi:hypothetical protein
MTQHRIKTPAIVLIEWLDAEHEFGWMDGNDISKSEPVLNCFSVGWLLAKTKHHVRLCQTFSDNNHAQTVVIPVGMIVSITTLQTSKVRHAKKSK